MHVFMHPISVNSNRSSRLRFVDMFLKPFNSEISNFEYNQLNIIAIKEIPSNGKHANNNSLAYS